jgi:hypothetical protein
MEYSLCTVCHSPKGVFVCGHCQEPVCKKCKQAFAKDRFAFLDPIPLELTHKAYCVNCYNRHIEPALEKYENTVARAKAVMVFHKGLGEETRLMSRTEKLLRIEGCLDKNEALLRLAFLAASAGFNALLDVDVSAEKLRNAGYQTTKWHASGVPTTLDPKKYEKTER